MLWIEKNNTILIMVALVWTYLYNHVTLLQSRVEKIWSLRGSQSRKGRACLRHCYSDKWQWASSSSPWLCHFRKMWSGTVKKEWWHSLKILPFMVLQKTGNKQWKACFVVSGFILNATYCRKTNKDFDIVSMIIR